MLCYLAYLEKYVIQQLKTQLVDCLVACSCCRHLSLFMKRGFYWNSVCKEDAWLNIEEDILFVSFFHWPCVLVTAALLLGTWLSTSFPMCFSFLKKKCFQLFEIFYFFIVYRNPFRCLEQKRFFMKCFPFADGNIFRFQMEPLSGDINGKIPPMKPSEC